MAKEKIKGDYHQKYVMLKDYFIELDARNMDITFKIQVETNTNLTLYSSVFKRIYVCLSPLKAGRREILGLDGAFIKGPFIGQVLTVVGVDSNNGAYPIAYAIFEADCKSSWLWFLSNLRDDANLAPNLNYTFISDRQKV